MSYYLFTAKRFSLHFLFVLGFVVYVIASMRVLFNYVLMPVFFKDFFLYLKLIALDVVEYTGFCISLGFIVTLLHFLYSRNTVKRQPDSLYGNRKRVLLLLFSMGFCVAIFLFCIYEHFQPLAVKEKKISLRKTIDHLPFHYLRKQQPMKLYEEYEGTGGTIVYGQHYILYANQAYDSGAADIFLLTMNGSFVKEYWEIKNAEIRDGFLVCEDINMHSISRRGKVGEKTELRFKNFKLKNIARSGLNAISMADDGMYTAVSFTELFKKLKQISPDSYPNHNKRFRQYRLELLNAVVYRSSIVATPILLAMMLLYFFWKIHNTTTTDRRFLAILVALFFGAVFVTRISLNVTFTYCIAMIQAGICVFIFSYVQYRKRHPA